MKLSTKGKYGLKAIFELSLHVNEGPMPLNMIASKQKIPEQYLEQIFSTLKKSQLITNVSTSPTVTSLRSLLRKYPHCATLKLFINSDFYNKKNHIKEFDITELMNNKK